MKIYIFLRESGESWADFQLPPNTPPTRVIEAYSREEIRRVITSEDGRVKALAERALLNYSEEGEAVERRIADEITTALREQKIEHDREIGLHKNSLNNLSSSLIQSNEVFTQMTFWQRLKWAIGGNHGR